MKKGVGLLLFFAIFLSFFSIVFAAPIDKSVIVEFGNGGSCYMTSNTSAWVDGSGQTFNWTVKNGLAVSDCFFPDSNGGFVTNETNETNSSCCPAGWNTCSQDIGSTHIPGGRCVVRVELCSNIGSEGSCNAASQDVAERTLGVKEQFIQYLDANLGICYSYSTAKCVWADTNISDGKNEFACTASFVNITGINDTVAGNCTDRQVLGSCVYEFAGQEDNCDNAKQSITISYTAMAKLENGSLVDPALQNISGWCNATTKDYACSASIQLPGFSLFNFFVSILGVGMVYFFFKKNFKEKD